MRLHLLHLGRMHPGDIPVPGYLITTDDGRHVLVDTGWPRHFVHDPQGPPGLEVVVRPEDTVVARLAELGLAPGDIHLLVCSHFDEDHAGNHELFTAAELLVQRRHYAAARAGHPRSAGSRASWDHPGLRYRLLDGDVEIAPGVEVLATSGHVPGHQSVLVRLPNTGPVLLAIDAVMHRAMADAATREIYVTDLDEAEVRASTQKLADVAAREHAALVVYGHDRDQWATLRQSPAFYD